MSWRYACSSTALVRWGSRRGTDVIIFQQPRGTWNLGLEHAPCTRRKEWYYSLCKSWSFLARLVKPTGTATILATFGFETTGIGVTQPSSISLVFIDFISYAFYSYFALCSSNAFACTVFGTKPCMYNV